MIADLQDCTIAARAALDGALPSASTPAKRPEGRPTVYSRNVAERICERIADGESVRGICRDPAMPGRSTVLRWLIEIAEFHHAYALAMRCRIEDMADECLAIADDATNDSAAADDGTPSFNKEHILRTQLRLGERHRWMAHMMPKRFGPIGPDDKPQMLSWEGDPLPMIADASGPSLIEQEADPIEQAIEAWRSSRQG